MNEDWLYGWKAIAGYIGVCDKTARTYYYEYGMPVSKSPTKKPWAIKAELMLWKNEYDRLKKEECKSNLPQVKKNKK